VDIFAEEMTGTETLGSEESTTATSQEDEYEEDDEEYSIQNRQPRAPPSTMQRSVELTGGEIQLVTAYYRLKVKIDKLSQKLTDCNGLTESKEICDAIKACADTALSIKKLL